jgi:hypothetical protein
MNERHMSLEYTSQVGQRLLHPLIVRCIASLKSAPLKILPSKNLGDPFGCFPVP